MNLSIAGLNIKVMIHHREVKELLRKKYSVYLADENVYTDFTVEATPEEIEDYKHQWQLDCPEWQYEMTVIFHQICIHMLDYSGFYMHSSVVELEGEAYAFAAASGTGKSTHTALWLKYFGEKARVVNGDKPLLRYMDGVLYACGHPWCGKEGWNTNCMTPLKAICFLERGTENKIRKIEGGEVIDRLFQQVLLPRNQSQMTSMFTLMNQLIENIPFYVLRCTISEESVYAAYEGMKDGKQAAGVIKE